MPRESRKNVGESVRARLLQRSRDESTDLQVLLTRSALERLLYRLSQFAHRHRFLLKGAIFATRVPLVLADLERVLLPLLKAVKADWRWKQRAGGAREIG